MFPQLLLLCAERGRPPRIARPALPAAATRLNRTRPAGPARMTEVPDRGRQAEEAPPGRAIAAVRRRIAPHGVEFAAQPGPLALRELAGGGDGALAERGRRRPARPGIPTPGDSRRRGSRAGPAVRDGAGVRAARAARRTSSRKPASSIASNRRAMRSCSTARSRGASTSLSTRTGGRSRACMRCHSEIGRPLRDTPPARAGCVADRWRGCGARRRDRRAPARRASPASRRCAASSAIAARNAGSASGIGARPCSSAWKYRPVPPARIGVLPRARMSSIAMRASRANSAAEYVSHGSRTSIRWCGTCARSSGDGLAAPMSRPR